MAFTAAAASQTNRIRVSVDFPTLPTAPTMTIAKDSAAMNDFQTALSSWYYSLRETLIDRLQTQADALNNQAAQITALQAQVNALPVPVTLPALTQTLANPPTQAQVQAIQDKLDALIAALKV